jgi:hypothetical protein
VKPLRRCAMFRWCRRQSEPRHCEEPTGPARSGRPDDRLRVEAIPPLALHWIASLSLAMTRTKRRSKSERVVKAVSSTKRPLSTRFRQKRRSGTPADAMSHARTQAACGAHHGKGGLRRPPLAGALACRRSTAVLANGTFVPRAQHRARLPERRHKGSGHSRKRRPFGHSDAPRAPVVMPAGMMPEPPGNGLYLSARGRRTRSALREYPPKRRPY